MSDLSGGAMALSFDGTVLLIADDSDLLAYDEATDGPAWLVAHKRPVVAICATEREFVVLDADGTVLGVDPTSGEVVWTMPSLSTGHALAVAPSGLWAALVGADITVGQRDEVLQILPLDTEHTGALAYAGEVLAVALVGGVVRLFPADGGPVDKRLPFDVSAMASASHGALGACGHHVVLINEESAKALITFDDTDQITGVATSVQGRMFAARVGDGHLAIMNQSGSSQLAHANFVDRVPGDVCFNRAGDVWVAMGQGHACGLGLSDGGVRRTDEHRGRPRGSWMVNVSIDDAADDPAMAEEAEDDQMDNMPLWARIGLSVFAVVVVLGGCLGLNMLLNMV
ncbi:MAG: hypothetical protein ACI9MC_002947 [Kiritimatiellia bacterium]|jgi:hypothetical protein